VAGHWRLPAGNGGTVEANYNTQDEAIGRHLAMMICSCMDAACLYMQYVVGIQVRSCFLEATGHESREASSFRIFLPLSLSPVPWF
jgi:hypothetical protein